MPSSEALAFSTPLRQALLARHQPATRASGDGKEAEGLSPEGGGGLVAAAYHEQEIRKAYEKGKAEGLVEAQAAHAAEMDRIKGDVHATLEDLNRIASTLASEVEALLPELVLEGVGRVLYSIQPDANEVKGIVDELLSGIDADGQQMRLSMHAEDIKLLKEIDPDLSERFPGLNIIKDAALSRGECFLESRFGLADARFSAKLNNLRKVLE